MKLSELLNNELIIPEIQRDYVWGNNEIVLRRFLNNIFNNNKKELDIGFFYEYKVYQNKEIYALIDGQQRITTLVLLYWYLGVDGNCIRNFKFKVRENCNNFLENLLKVKIDDIKKINVESISEKIKNCIWYLSIWDNDPTVKSMLKALDIIENEFNKITKEDIKSNIEKNIIFTCLTNDDRNVEKEYISLNARGRELEKYEELKAILVEDMKDRNKWLEKWEKNWQDILWECKGVEADDTDNMWNAVLYWARDIFVIENNICKPNLEKENNKNKKGEIDFDFELISIKDEYKNDLLKIINKNKDSFQKKCQFDDENKVIDIYTIIAGGKKDSYKLGNGQRALFYGLLYLVKSKYNIKNVESINSIGDLTINENDEILEKIRVFRNLIQNSYIDSSNLKNAVESLKLLAEKTIDNNFNELLKNKKIKGIDLEQRYEEALKLDIFKQYPKHKDIILKIENDTLFNGKIKDIFIIMLSDNILDVKKNYEAKTLFTKCNNYKILSNMKEKYLIYLFEKYKEIDDFGYYKLLGEMLLYDGIYNHNIETDDYGDIRLNIKEDNIITVLLKLFDDSKSKTLEEFICKHRKKQLKKFDGSNPLYILYLIYIMFYDKEYYLFENEFYNFIYYYFKSIKTIKIISFNKNKKWEKSTIFDNYKYINNKKNISIKNWIENINDKYECNIQL